MAIAGATQVQAAPTAEARAAAPAPEPFPDKVTVLVPGPADGRMREWADLLVPPLRHSLPPGTQFQPSLVGGPDGVTAANQFHARGVPDGATALLLPGEAPLAWLTGDPRARFDAGSWMPVMSGITSAILISRVPVEALRTTPRLRVASSVPAGPELPALLGLDLMGVNPLPAFGLNDPAAALQALRAGVVDAMFVAGPAATAVLPEARAAGAMALFTLGVPGEAGVQRDPFFPDVPTAPELAASLAGAPATAEPLAAAWRAAAAAVQTDFALVLPPLTTAALVAQWRGAGETASQALQGQVSGVRLLAGTAANQATASVAADPSAVLELRRWLAARFNWHPA